jgi:PKHD-type hydroxylase
VILFLPELLGSGALTQLKHDTGLATSLLSDALLTNDRFQRAVQPLRLGAAEVVRIAAGPTPPERRVSRSLTRAPDGAAVRVDIEVVCFLADPDAYQGGELVIDNGFGGVPRKGRPGACVVYPTSANAVLDPVSSGANQIARLGVQSCVRDLQQRTILYDLIAAADFLDLTGAAELATTLCRCRDRLFGLWAEV